MSNNPDDKFTAGKGYPIDLAQKITIIKGTGPSDSKVPHLVSGSKISGPTGQIITHTVPLNLRPATQIISQGMSSQPQLISGNQAVVGPSGVTASPLLQGAQIISQGTQGGGPIVGQTMVRTLPTAVRVLQSVSLPPSVSLPLQQHGHIATSVSNPAQRPQNTIAGQTTVTKQLTTNYHVPRGPATVASLAVPRASAAPRAPTPSPTPSWSSGTPLCYIPRPPRPHTLQVSAPRPPLRQVTPQVSTATVVARAVRPANAPSPQRTPPPQGLQALNPIRTSAPKVVPLVQRSYQQAKVVGVTTLGVRPTNAPRAVGGTYYYEVSSGVAPAAGPPSQQAILMNTAPSSLPLVQSTPLPHSLNNVVLTASHVNSFVGAIDRSSNDLVRAPSSPSGPQRPSILRKRDNECSPIKCNIPPPPIVTSPPPSPGGSTTVSAASSPGPDDDRDSPIPSMNQPISESRDLHSLVQAVNLPRDLHTLSQVVTQSRDLHSLTQAASQSREQAIRDHMMSQSREQIMSQSREQIMSQSREQIMSQSREQIMSQPREQIISQSREQIMSQSREAHMLSQMVSQSRDLHTLSQAVTQPRDLQTLTQAVTHVSQPTSQISSGSHSSGQNDQPPYNNCSPRKKPRKQLLTSERPRGGECEFPSEGAPPPSAPSPPLPSPPAPAPAVPPPEKEKPRRRALLGAGWKCGWRATALHFTRPTDVRKREEKKPTVVEIAAQRYVLQKTDGWKIHHLTAQMEDLVELEAGVLDKTAEILHILESKPQADHHTICELLKGNIQRSKIVGEGVSEARSNVLRIFHHKSHVSDILARQVDKRCFKKHRNQC